MVTPDRAVTIDQIVSLKGETELLAMQGNQL